MHKTNDPTQEKSQAQVVDEMIDEDSRKDEKELLEEISQYRPSEVELLEEISQYGPSFVKMPKKVGQQDAAKALDGLHDQLLAMRLDLREGLSETEDKYHGDFWHILLGEAQKKLLKAIDELRKAKDEM